MYICIYVYMYICIYVYMYICIYVYMYFLYICVYVYMYICIYVYMYIRIYVYMYICIYVCQCRFRQVGVYPPNHLELDLFSIEIYGWYTYSRKHPYTFCIYIVCTRSVTLWISYISKLYVWNNTGYV